MHPPPVTRSPTAIVKSSIFFRSASARMIVTSAETHGAAIRPRFYRRGHAGPATRTVACKNSPVALLLLLAFALSAQEKPPETCVLSGTVVNSVTGERLNKVEVRLESAGRRQQSNGGHDHG